MHRTDTLNTDTTLDIDDTQATVSDCNNPSAQSRLRSMFGYFAARASPTGRAGPEQKSRLDRLHMRCVSFPARFHARDCSVWQVRSVGFSTRARWMLFAALLAPVAAARCRSGLRRVFLRSHVCTHSRDLSGVIGR